MSDSGIACIKSIFTTIATAVPANFKADYRLLSRNLRVFITKRPTFDWSHLQDDAASDRQIFQTHLYSKYVQFRCRLCVSIEYLDKQNVQPSDINL